jgi:hypothetical protein
MSKNMTKKDYIDFYSFITGHSKSYVKKHIQPGILSDYSFYFGQMVFEAREEDSNIHLIHHFLGSFGVHTEDYFYRDTFNYNLEQEINNL